MPNPVRTLALLWRRAPLLTATTALAFLAAVIFAVRFALSVAQWHDLPRDPELQGWMTPRFVAHSWGVPPEVMQQVLPPLPDGLGRRLTLDDIATQQDISVDALLSDLRAAIDNHRERPER